MLYLGCACFLPSGQLEWFSLGVVPGVLLRALRLGLGNLSATLVSVASHRRLVTVPLPVCGGHWLAFLFE